MDGILWDVKTLRSCISKTIYPITLNYLNINFPANLKFNKIIVVLII